MRLLVTGANGFIGRRLCSDLAEQGYDVRAAVRRSPGAVGTSGHIVVIGDIDACTPWTHALQRVDVIFHLAARVHVMKETAADALSAFRAVNVQGTRNLA